MSSHSTSAPRSRRLRVTAGLVLLVGAVGALTGFSSNVQVVVDGEARDVRTYAGTVEGVLDRLDLELGPADEVEPALDTPIETGLEIDITRAVTIDVEVDGGVARRVTAIVADVADVLELADLADAPDRGAIVVPEPHTPVEHGDVVQVSFPVPVTVVADGEEQELLTHGADVYNALQDAGVELGPRDLVSHDPGTPLLSPLTITIQRVEVEQRIEQVVLEHDEQREETDDLERGRTEVAQEGGDGLRHDVYLVTIIDGEVIEERLAGEQVVEEPEDRVVLVGTAAPALPPAPAGVPALDDPVWDRLAGCESNHNWQAISRNGMYYGGLQFHPQTWRMVGGSGMPHHASRTEQIRRAQILLAKPWATWGNQWPACSRMLGLR